MNGKSYAHPENLSGYQGSGETSLAGALIIHPHKATLQRRVLDAVRQRPLTSIEIAEEIGHEYSAVQPRTTELRILGLIQDSGQRGRSRHPKAKAKVWEVTEKGAAQ